MENSPQKKTDIFDILNQMQNMLETMKKFKEKNEEISIEKMYTEQKKMLQIVKDEVLSLASENIAKMEEKYSEYIRPSQKRKRNLNQHIKDGLGISWTKEEVERVTKLFFFCVGGAKKWQDMPDKEITEKIKILEECIQIVKIGRDYQQMDFYKAIDSIENEDE